MCVWVGQRALSTLGWRNSKCELKVCDSAYLKFIDSHICKILIKVFVLVPGNMGTHQESLAFPEAYVSALFITVLYHTFIH